MFPVNLLTLTTIIDKRNVNLNLLADAFLFLFFFFFIINYNE